MLRASSLSADSSALPCLLNPVLITTGCFACCSNVCVVTRAAIPSLSNIRMNACMQVGRYGPELFDFSAERVTRSVAESLARLQVPYIDLLQCHDIEFGSLDQVGCGCLGCVYVRDGASCVCASN